MFFERATTIAALAVGMTCFMGCDNAPMREEKLEKLRKEKLQEQVETQSLKLTLEGIAPMGDVEAELAKAIQKQEEAQQFELKSLTDCQIAEKERDLLEGKYKEMRASYPLPGNSKAY